MSKKYVKLEKTAGGEKDMQKETERKHPVKALRRTLILALVCLALGVACFLAGRLTGGKAEKAPEISAVVLESQLAQISELASVSYAYTNMGQFENSNDFYGMKVPFTTKKFILTYDGVIKAGIDLSQVKVTVTEEKVRVRLPEAKILSHEIDADSVQIFDEKTSVFNPFTVEDFTDFQAEQKRVMEEKALAKGLLEDAKGKAAASVELLLSQTLPEGAELSVE